MNLEDQNITEKAGFFIDPQYEFLKSKTALRMHYEAQVRVIKNQIGGLEEVRAKLGLSQRKMAQLLMVDPSAWTRWTRKGDNASLSEKAPPHIWRALQWYLIIQEKIPGLTPQYFAVENPRTLHIQAMQKINSASDKIDHLQLGLVNKEEELVFLQTELIETKNLISGLEKKISRQNQVLIGLLVSLIFLMIYSLKYLW